MYNICRINNKAQILKNLSWTELHNVNKVSSDSKTPKIGRFFKGSLGTFSIDDKKVFVYCVCIET